MLEYYMDVINNRMMDIYRSFGVWDNELDLFSCLGVYVCFW